MTGDLYFPGTTNLKGEGKEMTVGRKGQAFPHAGMEE
jgi:hypothetical protein